MGCPDGVPSHTSPRHPVAPYTVLTVSVVTHLSDIKANIKDRHDTIMCTAKVLVAQIDPLVWYISSVLYKCVELKPS